MYGSETMIWKEKEKSRIRYVQMDNLRGLLGIRIIDKIPNAGTRELCGVMKGVDERIEEGVLRWFGHVERMTGLLRGSMLWSVLVVAQRVDSGRGGLIP